MSRWTKSLGLLLTLGVIALGGCGKNLPCETDPAQVDDARAALQSAEQELESARSELAAAEARKRELAGQLDNVADADELRDRLETLKKGSGR